jgi:serine/threonine-protein phosphatase 2A activator
MSDWGKICSGLMRLFDGEVLKKFPVIQHLLFGSVFAFKAL